MTWRASSKPSCVLPSLSNALARASYSLAESGASEMACARRSAQFESLVRMQKKRRRTRVKSSTAVSYEVARYAAIPEAYSDAAVFISRVVLSEPAAAHGRRSEQPGEQGSEPSLDAVPFRLQALERSEKGGNRGEENVRFAHPAHGPPPRKLKGKKLPLETKHSHAWEQRRKRTGSRAMQCGRGITRSNKKRNADNKVGSRSGRASTPIG